MREIKFRSYNPITKKMYYDFDQSISEVKLGKSIHQFVYDNGLIFDSLMQFTGLKDKNGVEIYEGDIVQDTIVGIKSKIIFTDYANFGIKSLVGVEDLEYDIIDPAWTETSVIVIGNIHENPELLCTSQST